LSVTSTMQSGFQADKGNWYEFKFDIGEDQLARGAAAGFASWTSARYNPSNKAQAKFEQGMVENAGVMLYEMLYKGHGFGDALTGQDYSNMQYSMQDYLCDLAEEAARKQQQDRQKTQDMDNVEGLLGLAWLGLGGILGSAWDGVKDFTEKVKNWFTEGEFDTDFNIDRNAFKEKFNVAVEDGELKEGTFEYLQAKFVAEGLSLEEISQMKRLMEQSSKTEMLQNIMQVASISDDSQTFYSMVMELFVLKNGNPGSNQRNNEHEEIADVMCNLTVLAGALYEMGVRRSDIAGHKNYSQLEDVLEEMVKIDLNEKDGPRSNARERAIVLWKLAMLFSDHVDTSRITQGIRSNETPYWEYDDGIRAINDAYERETPLGENWKTSGTDEEKIAYAEDYYKRMDRLLNLNAGMDQVLLSTRLDGKYHYVRLSSVERDGIVIIDPYGYFDTEQGRYIKNKNNIENTYGYKKKYTWAEVRKYQIGMTFDLATEGRTRHRTNIILRRVKRWYMAKWLWRTI